MENAQSVCRVAVIGMGPRGLAAAEALAARAADGPAAFHVEAFDPEPWPGAGPNFSPAQDRLAELNLPLREVALPPAGRGDEAWPDFAVWAGAGDGERHPPRAELGAYFAARCARLKDRAHDRFSISFNAAAVDSIEGDEGGWRLRCGGAWRGPFEEALLTLGQPPTAPDPQQRRWRRHGQTAGADFLSPYPTDRFLKAARGWRGLAVGVRGLGLTTLDALRLLTLGLGGRFEDGRYRPSGREPARIIPFSLDGRPPAPKPATAALDARFDPTPAETRAFEAALRRALAGAAEGVLEAVTGALAPAARRAASALGAQARPGAVEQWLATEREASGAQSEAPAIDQLRAEIAMAEGAAPPSIGYAVGQIWRKWQGPLRRVFDGAGAPPALAEALVGFDEGLKRFSYGPSLASARGLAILAREGRVDLRVVDDPDVVLTPTGWRLVDGDDRTEVAAMVDAVLPSPALEASRSPLIERLKATGRIAAAGEGLGARIRADGLLLGPGGDAAPGLAMLGRLTLGGVAAPDSIHDCFGPAAGRWAEGVLARSAGRRRAKSE